MEEVKSIEPIKSIQEVKHMYELTDSEAALLKNMIEDYKSNDDTAKRYSRARRKQNGLDYVLPPFV